MTSNGTGDYLSPSAIEQMREVCAEATAPAAPRAEADIARFFDGLGLIPPGICDVASWHASPQPGQPSRTLFLGGVGGKL
jgi:S-adenosyl methyltransferase